MRGEWVGYALANARADAHHPFLSSLLDGEAADAQG
jgi:hypothetical protein